MIFPSKALPGIDAFSLQPPKTNPNRMKLYRSRFLSMNSVKRYCIFNVMRVLLFLVLLVVAAGAWAQSVVRGPIVGAVTDLSARVLIQLDSSASVSIEFSEDQGFSRSLIMSSVGNAESALHYF